jgi:PAS domain-containing protein
VLVYPIQTCARRKGNSVEERTKGFLPEDDPSASAETFATFFEAISEGMAPVEAGRITAVNRTAATILGVRLRN